MKEFRRLRSIIKKQIKRAKKRQWIILANNIKENMKTFREYTKRNKKGN